MLFLAVVAAILNLVIGKEVKCEEPVSPEHGTLHLLGDGKVDSLVLYSCEDGWKLVGASASKCHKTGQWTSPPPKCVEKGSSNLSTPTARVATPTSVPPERKVTPEVIETHDHDTPLTPELTEKEECSCAYNSQDRALFATVNGLGLRYGDEVKKGDKITISCYDQTKHLVLPNDTSIYGTLNLTCDACQTWTDGVLPSCEKAGSEITCRELTETDLMKISYTDHLSVGSIANFHCFAPGIRSGVSRTQCLPTGEWSHSPPTCIMYLTVHVLVLVSILTITNIIVEHLLDYTNDENFPWGLAIFIHLAGIIIWLLIAIVLMIVLQTAKIDDQLRQVCCISAESPAQETLEMREIEHENEDQDDVPENRPIRINENSPLDVCNKLAYVTYGSVIKLFNKDLQLFLHSQKINYTTGSAQQSVTAIYTMADANLSWVVKGKDGEICAHGGRIACGTTIRLEHLATLKNLHSHHFPSPVSDKQEVSAFGENGEGDTGDNWIMMCNSNYWERSGAIRLKHADTGMYLAMSEHLYGNIIWGEREICAIAVSDSSCYWNVTESVFV